LAWFRKEKTPLEAVGEKNVKTEGLWTKCDGCRQIVWKKDLEEGGNVCPKCGYHFRLDARTRLQMLFDGEWTEFDQDLGSSDPLHFVDLKPYPQKLAAARKATGLRDALIAAQGTLASRPVAICSMEIGFIGGSMGAVVGEMIARSIDRCLAGNMPLVIVSASGGARMQEGAISLMQLAKVSAGLARMHERGIPYISVLADPTTGGVTASYAMLGDLNIAEPGALIGFAGPRVIQQTIRQKLPEGFQRSEFLLKKGMLDAIVPRKELKTYIARALDFCCAPTTASVTAS